MQDNTFKDQLVLRLDRVTHFFDQRLVFKNVSLEVRAGSVTLVAGPNGAGKTTLMSIMSGLVQPSSGLVKHGVAREKVGFIGHNTFIYPGLTALDNLRFWAGIYALPLSQDQLIELLDSVGLKAFVHEKAGRFSRGMSQRLSLARVLMLDPELMLLDEPGTGLDTGSRELLRSRIAQAVQDQAAVVWISHTLEEDLDLTDTVLYLDNKQAAFYGSAREFRSWNRGTGLE
ncbi:ABC transporter ATP-binding protein [Desulfonatronovibrio hydrogenovorans]|uniref:ABC transporter ATP-binding protein n=1 Tax=Desulfonatronovibrio hydrogenovorans TaxID=53245 RepID=UPI000B2F33F8|nr:ABC transporter ATP-binding protein [Desulfonatronovibrio hydrogenovorans]